MATTLEARASSTVCRMCGTAYGKLNGYFYRSYAQLYKGVGYLPYCKECVDKIFEGYVLKYKDSKIAVRHMCRKLDIIWDEPACDGAIRMSATRTVFSGYLSKMNATRFSGKSYDDTVSADIGAWDTPITFNNGTAMPDDTDTSSLPILEISDDVKQMWGPGYSDKQYHELEQRRKYWIEDLTAKGVDVDGVGVQPLLRQIVSTELDINRGRASGEDVDKKVNTLNTLLGSTMLKPNQAKAESTDSILEKTPYGVWIKRFEDDMPIPEPEPEFRDVDGIVRYITIWFLGHLCHMLNIRNTYCKLYEDEIAKLRIERPEFDEEDDETMFNDIFGDNNGGDAVG